MSNWILKFHLFLFYSSVSCTIVYLSVYYKTFTDCSYHEIGLLVMFTALGGAILKPLICSYADRHGNHKNCLILSVAINGLSTFSLALVPFYPQLLFDEPHPRLMWYLVALNSFIGLMCLSFVTTLSDVFVVQECLQSRIGEHIGQFRAFGGFGWALSSISVALVEPYIQLPYLALPLLASGLFLLIDLVLIMKVNEIRPLSGLSMASSSERIGSRCGSISAITSNEIPTKIAVCAANTKPLPAKIEMNHRDVPSTNKASINLKVSSTSASTTTTTTRSREQEASSNNVYATVAPDRLSRTTRQDASNLVLPITCNQSSGGANHRSSRQQQSHRGMVKKIFNLADARGSNNRISFMTQLELLIRLSRHDKHHPIKYLAMFVLIGAFNQTHYVFWFQYFTEILNARQLIAMLFIMNAFIQVSNCLGETLGLLCIVRRLVGYLGRDITFMLAIILSGFRAFLIGYLVEELNIYLIAMLESLTGLLFAINYTLMLECGGCYLSILDRLLLIEDDDCQQEQHKDATNFSNHLEELKEIYSIESIRFALRATVQGIFNAGEGVGYALGPLFAGIWLSMSNDSMKILYRDMLYAHLAILFAIMLFEFCLMRLLLGSHSKIDRLMIGGGGGDGGASVRGSGSVGKPSSGI